jgi:hypothetical protein
MKQPVASLNSNFISFSMRTRVFQGRVKAQLNFSELTDIFVMKWAYKDAQASPWH